MGLGLPERPTIESRQAAVRVELIAAQDKLHIAERKFAVAVQRCDKLSTTVASLQQHIITCVDECSAALEVERELRYEVEARVQDLLCELAFKTHGGLADTGVIGKTTSGAWKETSSHVQQMDSIAIAAFERCDMLEKESLKQNDLIRELSAKVAAQDGLQNELAELKGKVTRYQGMEAELRMKVREHRTDIRQKIKAGQSTNF